MSEETSKPEGPSNPFHRAKIEQSAPRAADELTFEELVDKARERARNNATKNLLKLSKVEYNKMLQMIEGEGFLDLVTKHVENRLKAARSIK